SRAHESASGDRRRRGGRQRDRFRDRSRQGPGAPGQGALESMSVRGIRGATTAETNTPESITEATEELLTELIRLNTIDKDEICFAYFTTTHDLTAEFPAYAARKLGWLEVPLLCGHDMDVRLPNPRGVPMC